MEKTYKVRWKRSFENSLLDTRVPNRKIKFFPTPTGFKSKVVRVLPESELKPEKYVPPKPKPEPEPETEPRVPPRRLKQLERLHNRLREEDLKRSKNSKVSKKVRKLMEQIESIYEKERKLGEIVKEKSRALKNYAKSFEVTIVESRDPAKQLNYTRQYVLRTLEEILKKEKGLKATRPLNITLKKQKVRRWRNVL